MNLIQTLRMDAGLMTNVSPIIMEQRVEDGYAADLLNLIFNDLGIPQKRPGVSTVDGVTPLPGSGMHLGLYEYHNSVTDEEFLITVRDNVIYAHDGNSWSDIHTESGVEQNDWDFMSFWVLTPQEVLVGVNGEVPPVVWDGTTVTHPTQMPEGRFIQEYRNRIILTGEREKPYNLYLSSAGSYEQWDPTETGSSALIAVVGPNDGQVITGIQSIGEQGLLIGKKGSLYALFGYTRSNMVVDLMDSNVGVASHKSMKHYRPYCYFLGHNGIYRYNLSDPPEKISRSIEKVFEERVEFDSMSDAQGFVYDQNYILSVPNVDGRQSIFVFNLEREAWSVWDRPQMVQRTRATQVEGELIFVRENDDGVYKLDKDSTVDSLYGAVDENIEAYIEMAEIGGSSLAHEKDFRDAYLLLRIPDEDHDCTVMVRTDGSDWYTVGRDTRVTGNEGDSFVIRNVIGSKNARFFSLKVENLGRGDLQPMAITYTVEGKEVR